jgi:hypothetical protein
MLTKTLEVAVWELAPHSLFCLGSTITNVRISKRRRGFFLAQREEREKKAEMEEE